MGGTCCSARDPVDSKYYNIDTDEQTVTEKRNRRRKYKNEGRSLERRRNADTDSESDSDYRTDKRSRNRKRKKVKFQTTPPDRDESYIDSSHGSPESTPSYYPPAVQEESPEVAFTADAVDELFSDDELGLIDPVSNPVPTAVPDVDASPVDDTEPVLKKVVNSVQNEDIKEDNDDDIKQDEHVESENHDEQQQITRENEHDDEYNERAIHQRTITEEDELLITAYRAYTNIDIRDRNKHQKTYKQCFVGSQFVDYLVDFKIALTRNAAVIKGQEMVKQGIVEHVTDEHDFKDETLFYKFLKPETLETIKTKYKRVIESREEEDTSVCQLRLLKGLELEARKGLDIQDRKKKLKKYEQCFVGEEAVTWMWKTGYAGSRNEGVTLGNLLMDAGIIEHVTNDSPFRDTKKLYRFVEK